MIKIQPPFFDPDLAETLTRDTFPGFLEKLEEGDEISGVLLDHINCPDLRLERMDWKNCRFEGCKLQGFAATGSYFADVTFRDCDLSGGEFRDCVFSKTRFEGCRLTGAGLPSSAFRDVVMDQTVCDYASFAKARVKAMLFRDCSLSDSGFEEINWKSLAFEQSNLGGANFLGTSLKDIDLTSCILTGALFTARELKGAVVNSQQALELAMMLGVVIRD